MKYINSTIMAGKLASKFFINPDYEVYNEKVVLKRLKDPTDNKHISLQVSNYFASIKHEQRERTENYNKALGSAEVVCFTLSVLHEDALGIKAYLCEITII